MMISSRARSCRRRLDHIKPVHLFLAFGHPALCGEIAGILEISGLRGQEIRIERKYSLGLAEVVNRIYWSAEGCDRTGPRVVVIDRLILMPLGLGKLRQN